MARITVVLVSTLMFAVLGLLMGYLCIQAAEHTMRGVTDGDILGYYVFVPLCAGVIGFVLSAFTMWLFARTK